MIPEQIEFTEADVRRLVEWSSFVDEIQSDSDRGVVLATAAKVEDAAKKLLEAALGPAMEHFRNFYSVAAALRSFGLVSENTFRLLDAVRGLRNEAAHSLKPFSLVDRQPTRGADKATSNAARAEYLNGRLGPHIARVRSDEAWADHRELGLRGDFVIAMRLLWEGLEQSAVSVPPLVSAERETFDLEATDPEGFCVVTREEMEARQREWEEELREQYEVEAAEAIRDEELEAARDDD